MAAAALVVASTAMSIYAQQQEAQNQADIAKKQAELKRQEASELLARAEINARSLEQQGVELQASQQASFAGGNVGVGASPLMFVEAQNAKVKEEIALLHREANFRATQLGNGASVLTNEASQANQTGIYKSIGSGLAGGSSLISMQAKTPATPRST